MKRILNEIFDWALMLSIIAEIIFLIIYKG